jgi:hypothetical protein
LTNCFLDMSKLPELFKIFIKYELKWFSKFFWIILDNVFLKTQFSLVSVSDF